MGASSVPVTVLLTPVKEIPCAVRPKTILPDATSFYIISLLTPQVDVAGGGKPTLRPNMLDRQYIEGASQRRLVASLHSTMKVNLMENSKQVSLPCTY